MNDRARKAYGILILFVLPLVLAAIALQFGQWARRLLILLGVGSTWIVFAAQAAPMLLVLWVLCKILQLSNRNFGRPDADGEADRARSSANETEPGESASTTPGSLFLFIFSGVFGLCELASYSAGRELLILLRVHPDPWAIIAAAPGAYLGIVLGNKAARLLSGGDAALSSRQREPDAMGPSATPGA